MSTAIEGAKKAPAFPIPPEAVQKQSFETVLQELDKSGKGHVSTFANVARLAPYIDTVDKARKSLALAEKYLLEAHALIKRYGFLDHLFGVAEANFNLLLSNWNSIQKVKSRLPKDGKKKPEERDAKITALCLLQSLDNLRFTDKMTSQSTSLAREFLAALKQVLQFVVKEIIVPTIKFIVDDVAKPLAEAAMPIWLPALAIVGGFLVVKSIAVKKATG